jgi:hypothetical protein
VVFFWVGFEWEIHPKRKGRLASRHRRQARSHCGPGTPARDWSTVRPPSPAGQLPQGSVYTCKRLVDWQAAIAGRSAPTVDRVHLQEIGRLSGRHRWQASSHSGPGTSAGNWSAGRAPSLASQLPQGNGVNLQEIGRQAGRHRWQASSHRGMGYTCERLVGCQAAITGRPAPTMDRCLPPALHHSIGRAVARLLLILTHPPRRQAEWRRSSGGQARSAVRRSRTHREEVVAKQTGGDAPR